MTNATSLANTKSECRVNRLLGYAAIVIAAGVIGSTLFGWTIIGLTTLLRD
jgi:hypothetical protein